MENIMFFGNNNKLKDEQIDTLQTVIEELNKESKEQLANKKKELKRVNLELKETKKTLLSTNKNLEIQMTKNKTLNDQLESMTNEDIATGTYNKRYFYDIAENIISLSKREKKSIAVAIIYIDKYQKIKDKHGEDTANKIVQLFIQKITNVIRESDVFVRFNEDEFVILFPNTEEDQAQIVADKLKESVQHSNMVGSAILNINIGVAEFIYLQENINTTLQRAKQTLVKTEDIQRDSIDKSA